MRVPSPLAGRVSHRNTCPHHWRTSQGEAPVHFSGLLKTKTDTQGFAKDRKELILQYLSGLASPSQGKDQSVVQNFLSALGANLGKRDPMFYLNIIQKMKGEWYNQEGETSGPAMFIIYCLIRLLRSPEADVIHEMRL